MRLIDADALIAEYPDDVLTHCDIEATPTIDARPVVHGKWKPVRYTTYCSCGKSYETYHYLCTACNHVAYAQPYGLKYCPNCGAKMDKEANDDD